MGEYTFHQCMKSAKAGILLENSFEHNQSYPVLNKIQKRTSFGIHAKGIQDLTGEEYDSYSYSKDVTPNLLNASRSSNTGSFFDDEDKSSCPKDRRKALLTVCTRTVTILTANKTACDLFGYSSSEFIGLKFSSLFGLDATDNENSLLQDICEVTGTINNTSGEIADVIHKKGFEMPVAIWARRVNAVGANCCIVVVEPVERISCTFEFDDQGEVLHCDDKFAVFHGFQGTDLIGQPLRRLMPTYILPSSRSISKQIRLQWTTSTTNDGLSFPVTVHIISQEKSTSEKELSCSMIYKAKMWIFPNVSGLLTCRLNGDIQSINNNFSLSLFGYTAAEVSTKNITELIPNLLDHVGNGNLYNSAVPQIEIDSCLNFSYNEPENVQEKDVPTDTSESWIEVSIQERQTREKLASTDVDNSNADSAHNVRHNDFLDKVNALLSKCAAPSAREISSEAAPEKDGGGDANSDSAIHSISSGCKCGNKGETGGKESAQSSFSGYHSGDGYHSPVGGPRPQDSKSSQSAMASSHDTSKSICSDLSLHDQSSFVIVEDHGGGEPRVINDAPPAMLNPLMTKLGEKNPILAPNSAGSEVTSTPVEYGRRALSRLRSKRTGFELLRDGFYKGTYRHKNGSMIDMWYDVKRVEMEGGGHMWSFRVHVQLSLAEACSLEAVNCTLSTNVSTLPSLNTSRSSLLEAASLDGSRNEGARFDENDEKLAVAGEFGTKYSVIKSIGSGAFGFVKIAESKSSAKKYVVKFIKKDKVLDECWVKDDESDNFIPVEVSLLSKFDHPHIIRVIEYFENKHFFGMVMPKHGQQGLDLFEFIDRCNTVDEALCSYIFRQVVSAVKYLHAHNVLHRDIKDENIIIDENFYCKLIDFGSSTFMKPGREFATFCGTVEYCSPEVLLGNKYRGPELEMWALGVTLYTLVFGENPFKNVEETLKCEPCPPYVITEELASVLQWLLQPDPEFRCTMQELLECPWLNQHVDITQYHWNDVICTPAASLNSSIAQLDVDRSAGQCHKTPNLDLDEENLCEELEKLAVSPNKCNQQSRKILNPIDNVMPDLNKTI